MAMFTTAARLSAIALLAATAACQHRMTKGTTLARKPPSCNGECGTKADRGLIVVLPADFRPESPTAVLKTYAPDTDGDGEPTADWNNSDRPPGKATPLDCDLTRLVRPTEGRKGFAFVAIEMTNPDYYFDPSDAIETDDAATDRFLRHPKVRKNGRRLVFKVKLVDAAKSKWITYDLFVKKRSGGPKILVDPKIRNSG